MSIFNLFSKENNYQPAYDYNPKKEKPVIRASICTGEQVAGFKSRSGGEFHEVMLIRDNLRHLEPEGDKMQVGWPVYNKLWDGIR